MLFAQCRYTLLAGLLGSLLSAQAWAGSHLWRVTELFSSADQRVQFIELTEVGGSQNEFHLTGKWFMTDSQFYEFPTDLPGPTANLKFLIATAAFAELPGAPAPDYIVPEGFFDPAGDTLVYFTYDSFTLPDETMPADGVTSMNRYTLTTGANTPTNFAGETGSIQYLDADADGIADALDNCSQVSNDEQRDSDGDGFGNLCDPDLNNDGVIDFQDLQLIKEVFFSDDADADLTGDGNVTFDDLAIMKMMFFGAPGPGAS